jgi:hypothetical protein
VHRQPSRPTQRPLWASTWIMLATVLIDTGLSLRSQDIRQVHLCWLNFTGTSHYRAHGVNPTLHEDFPDSERCLRPPLGPQKASFHISVRLNAHVLKGTMERGLIRVKRTMQRGIIRVEEVKLGGDQTKRGLTLDYKLAMFRV